MDLVEQITGFLKDHAAAAGDPSIPAAHYVGGVTRALDSAKQLTSFLKDQVGGLLNDVETLETQIKNLPDVVKNVSGGASLVDADNVSSATTDLFAAKIDAIQVQPVEDRAGKLVEGGGVQVNGTCKLGIAQVLAAEIDAGQIQAIKDRAAQVVEGGGAQVEGALELGTAQVRAN